jgi:hypothetical protein
VATAPVEKVQSLLFVESKLPLDIGLLEHIGGLILLQTGLTVEITGQIVESRADASWADIRTVATTVWKRVDGAITKDKEKTTTAVTRRNQADEENSRGINSDEGKYEGRIGRSIYFQRPSIFRSHNCHQRRLKTYY